jgi:hypothetical protein
MECYKQTHKPWFENPNYSLFKYSANFMREMNLSSQTGLVCTMQFSEDDLANKDSLFGIVLV